MNHPFFDSISQANESGPSLYSQSASPTQRDLNSTNQLFFGKNTPNLSLNENSIVRLKQKSRLTHTGFSPGTP